MVSELARTSSQGVVWTYPLLRASNEGLLRPRVARAQKIIRLHPLLCSASTRDRPDRPSPIFSVIVIDHGFLFTSACCQLHSPKEAQASDHARDCPTICAIALACVPCIHEGGAGLAADRTCCHALCPRPPPMARRQLVLSRVLQAGRDSVSLSPFTRQASRRDVERIWIALPRACDRCHHT